MPSHRPFLSRLLSRAMLAACLLASPLAYSQGAQGTQGAQSAPSAASSSATASAEPAASRPTPVLPQIKSPEAAANPYGLRALWQQGDWVARITLLILVIMSLGSWYVLVAKLIAQSRMGGQGKAANQNFWKADTVRQGAERLQPASPYRFIAESALEATRKHDGLIGQVDLNTWTAQSIERAVATVHGRTQEGLAVLATVGSTAPFVGLFGTVWGIYNALVKIGASGQASIDKVAGPVGEALIMTALGLAVAVPAVLGYNWLVRRNKVAMDTVRGFGSDLHTVLLAANAKRSPAQDPV
nr:MotA/TolQ/ExbB proton channel family protein [Ramlibacter sp. WS9]